MNEKNNQKSSQKPSWDSSLYKIFLIFAFLSFVVRTFFLVIQRQDIDFSISTILETYAIGLLFDAITFLYISIAPLVYFTIISNNCLNSKIHKKINQILYFLALYLILFGYCAEIVFWDEFQTRFNFIAVDYLIYTTEVIGNIVESYPIFQILLGIFLITSSIFYVSYKKIITDKNLSYPTKIRNLSLLLTLCILCFLVVNSNKISSILPNKYLSEISKNGLYELFSAYRHNDVDYHQLYEDRKLEDSIREIRKSISKQEPNSKFIEKDSIARIVNFNNQSSEKKYNIMFVVMESFSAEFMKEFGNKNNITPNLDLLSKQGLFFKNLYATGTRTVRGLEALSLSVPPTPGNSIIRRQNNENLFNISSPLNERGYDSKFIYGGFGYFDNMNYFFGNNGFKVVDREKFSENEISFSNVWGVSDEDLFNKTIQEADESYSNKKPFFNLIMTTSNHRPFTYPDNKIDIKSKTSRDGAVKYSDYAIGKFIENAKKKPWFDNTIFVFVSDHCAGSAGNTDLPVWRYQIPAIFYAPKIIKPRVFTKITSQIDIAPTLFGIMNLTYNSKFFGTDVIRNKNYDRHVFISTYLDIGYFEDGKLYMLSPKKKISFFDVKIDHFGWNGSKEIKTTDYEKEELEEVIAYYEVASEMFKYGKLKRFKK